MRSFSKKLAFVLAAAMVVTAFAPAASAKAADEMAITKSEQILYVNEGINHKGGEVAAPGKGNVSVYDFNLKNKPDDWKTAYSFAWSSSDEDVVTVAKGGVATAVGVGKATVYCKVTEKATKEVTTLKTKVTVKANAYKVEITNADDWDGATVEVNDVVDLNRAMYDEDGNKTTKRGTLVTDYTKWVAEPSTGIEIDDSNGQFKFTEDAVAGEYKLSCYTYQSSKYTEKTAESEAIVVEFVKGNSYEVKQTTRDDIVLTFDQALELNVADITIKETVNVIGGTEEVEYLVKSATPSEDKKTYTVAVFYEFNDGATYEVMVKGIDETVKFVASKGAPKTIVLHSNPYNTADRSVTVEQDTAIIAKLYDAKGVDVTNAELLEKLTYTVKYADSSYERMDTSLYFTQVGETAVVTAEYRTYEYDENGNEKDVVKSEPFTFYAVAKGEELITGITGYTTTGSFWSNDRTVVKMNDNRYLSVNYRTKDYPYNDMLIDEFDEALWNYGGTVYFGTANFTALNPDVLEVYSDGGKVGLYPRKTGTARIMVSYVTDVNGIDVTTAIGTVTIDVKDSPVLGSIALDQTNVTICTDPADNVNSTNVENMSIALKAKDQYSSDYYNIATTTVGVNGLKGNNALSQSAVDLGAVVAVDDGDGHISLQVVNEKFEDVMDASTVTKATKFSFTLSVKDSTPGVNIVKTVGFEVYAKRPVDTNTKDDVAITLDPKAIEFVVDFGGIQWNNNNVARFFTNDYNTASEQPKQISMSLYQLNNGARYDEIMIEGVLPSAEDIKVASPGAYYYVINWNGNPITSYADFEAKNTYTNDNGTGNKINFKFSRDYWYNDRSSVDPDRVIVGYDSSVHGAGKYEVILYRIDGVTKNGETIGKETRVASRSINVTCDPGKYSFVSRDEAIITLAADATEPTQSQLMNCFTIADTTGAKVSHNSWELTDTTAKFGDFVRDYHVNIKDYVENLDGTDSVFVESITVWEEVTVAGWGETTPVYVEYTVPVNYMVKVVK